MELRHLGYFIAVAEELSFTLAAQRLNTAQPSLSQQVRRLERDVGTALLKRSKGSKVHLTAAGRVFLREARSIVRQAQQAVTLSRAAAEGRTGELSIGVSQVAQIVILPKIMPLAMKQMPKVKLVVHSYGFREQIAKLRDYSIDIGFVRGPLVAPDFTVQTVLTEKFIVVLPSSHYLAEMRRIPIRLLDNQPCITISRGMEEPIADLVAAIYQQAGIRPRSVQEVDSLLPHLEMVAAGIGYTLLPEYVKAVLPPGVVARPLDWDPAPPSSIVMVHRKDDDLPALLTLKNLVAKRFGLPSERSSR